MEENPYQSPQSVPEANKPKPPAQPPNRYSRAALYGFMAWAGLAVAQAFIVEIVWVQTGTPYSLAVHRLALAICAPIALPVGLLIAWWTLKAPDSKWVLAVALALGLSFSVVVIGMRFFGLE